MVDSPGVLVVVEGTRVGNLIIVDHARLVRQRPELVRQLIAAELSRSCGTIFPVNGARVLTPFTRDVVSGLKIGGILAAEKSPVRMAAVGTVVRLVVPCRRTKPS